MKIQMRLGVVLAFFIASLAAILIVNQLFERQFAGDIFRQQAIRERQYFDTIITLKESGLKTLAYDYTYWDEMVSFVETRDAAWAAQQLEPALKTYGADMIAIYDEHLKPVYFKATPETEVPRGFSIPLSEDLVIRMSFHSGLCHFFMMTDRGPVEVWGASIHPSNDIARKTHPRGYFFVARAWGSAYLRELSQITKSAVSVSREASQRGHDFAALSRDYAAIFSEPLPGFDDMPVGFVNVRTSFPFLEKIRQQSLLGTYLISLFAIIIFSVIIAYFSYFVSFPLGRISRALKTDDPAYIKALLSDRTEFGDVARLIRQSVEQRANLLAAVQEQERARSAAVMSEAKYRSLYEYAELLLRIMPSALYSVDTKRRIVSWNKRAEEIVGYSAAEAIGKECSFFTEEPCRSKCGLYTSDIRKPIIGRECAIRTKDGRILTVLKNADLIYDAKGALIGGVEIFEDITDRKAAEHKLKEAMETKTNFVSMVSHELRTPLTAINESIGIVQDGSAGPVNDEQRDFLGTAKRNVDRLVRLINDVLDFQKLEAGRMEMHLKKEDVNDVVREVAKAMAPPAEKKGLRLETNLAERLPQTSIDRDRITQVLINLANNALKFTEAGSVTIATALTGGMIRVSVIDTGPGIPLDEQGKLFLAFQQLSEGVKKRTGGTGLGLAISKEIVRRHGGAIGAESEPGKGTAFYFTLPV